MWVLELVPIVLLNPNVFSVVELALVPSAPTLSLLSVEFVQHAPLLLPTVILAVQVQRHVPFVILVTSWALELAQNAILVVLNVLVPELMSLVTRTIIWMLLVHVLSVLMVLTQLLETMCAHLVLLVWRLVLLIQSLSHVLKVIFLTVPTLVLIVRMTIVLLAVQVTPP
jgi:hypothetical protein